MQAGLQAPLHLPSTEDCEGPDLIYLPEVPFDIEKFLVKSERPSEKEILRCDCCIRRNQAWLTDVMSASLEASGDYVDAFGHKQLQGTATYLANFLAAECGCKTRAVELSTLTEKRFPYGIPGGY